MLNKTKHEVSLVLQVIIFDSQIWTSGAYFIGEYEDNWRHGYGEYYDINGDVYKGNWVSSYKEGQGTMTYNDGTVKSGLWNKDKFQG